MGKAFAFQSIPSICLLLAPASAVIGWLPSVPMAIAAMLGSGKHLKKDIQQYASVCCPRRKLQWLLVGDHALRLHAGEW